MILFDNSVKKIMENMIANSILNKDLVQESPYKNEQILTFDKDNKYGNLYAVEQLGDKPHISFDISNFGKCFLIREKDDDRLYDSWLTPDNILSATFIFDPNDNGLETVSIWNEKQHKGFCRALIFEYYLKHFAFVVSSNSNTAAGILYWKKLINEAEIGGYKTVLVVDGKDIPIDYSSVNSLWGNSKEHSDTRIKIYGK